MGWRLATLLVLLASGCGTVGAPKAAAPGTAARESKERSQPTHADLLANLAEGPACPSERTRTIRREFCTQEEPEGSYGDAEPDCLLEVAISITFCDGKLSHAMLTAHEFGLNGSRALHFDEDGNLELMWDDAHGSLWMQECLTHQLDGMFCTLCAMHEWTPEDMETEGPPLRERLRKASPCASDPAWPLKPFAAWQVADFDPQDASFDATDVRDNIALIRYVLAEGHGDHGRSGE